MRSDNQIPRLWEDASTIILILACVAVLLLIAFVTTTANAQTFVNTPTTTTLWAGTQDFNQFGLASVTSPGSGLILEGTAPSTVSPTGHVRHLWYGDSSNGLCRVDPELDLVVANPAPGIGGHFNVIQTCIGAIQAAAFVPGQMAFDATTNTVYTTNVGRTTAGIIRTFYNPAGDNGHGTMDPIRIQSLMGTTATRNAAGGCPQITSPKTKNKVPLVPSSSSIGPDGNLYVGNIRDGAIIRILSPATFDPSVQSDCQNKIQIPILSADSRVGAGHTFGMGWVGHTLLGADNIAPWVLFNADQCLTPANGNRICGAPAVSGAQLPTEVLAAFVPGPQAAAVTDAQFPAFPGNIFYAASFPTATKITNITSNNNLTVQTSFGGTFAFITGLTPDPADLNNANLYVGSDPTQGSINGAAAIYLVTTQAPPPAPPLAPFNLAAVAGTNQANVTWAPTTNGQPITTYIVRTLLAPLTPGNPATPSGVADVTVGTGTGVAPLKATITALTNGTSYVFEVQACNASGCSPFSTLSNAVTPFVVTAPPTPTGVTAVASTLSASVAWSQNGNGGSPITSSTVSAFDSLAPNVIAASAVVVGSGTGASVNGLVAGHTYTFTVHANSAVGQSPDSTRSLPITIATVSTSDISITVTSPASINAGSVLTYTMTVRNGGPGAVASVSLNSTLPFGLVGSTQSQGACSGTPGLTAFNCNLGGMVAGATATVTVSVLLDPAQTSGSATDTATVSVNDPTVTDPNPANNTASATTTIGGSGGGTGGGGSCAAATTDIQVVGSAQNGGPAINSGDTFTWQIKDNQGNTPADCVVFTSTLPGNFSINTVTPTQGTCSNAGNAITCNLGTINGGSTALVTVNVNVGPTAGSFPTTGSATFSGTDSQPANNSFTVTIQPK
jgi:uncharacterized repeat protein (TIGR01451 family)